MHSMQILYHSDALSGLCLWGEQGVESLRPKRISSLVFIFNAVMAELFSHRECHNYLGLVWGCRLPYLIARIYLFRVEGWNIISGEKSQTWAVFLFGGFSHSSHQVLAHGSPLVSFLLPPLVHRELGAVFTASDFRCLIFRCVEEECGHAEGLLQIQPFALAWI